jgi:hypothetical protein
LIGAEVTEDDVIAVTAGGAIDPESAREGVATWATDDDVVALIPADDIVTETTADGVVSLEADDDVVSGRTDENVIPSRSGHRRNLARAARKLSLDGSCEDKD